MRQPDWILVVSPDPNTLLGLARALAQGGLPVAQALGWAESRSWLSRIPVSLLVADVGELGPEDLVRLRRLRAEFPQLGIIALASLSTPEARAAEADGSLLAVLEKPIALGRLEEVVSAARLPRALP
jgi:DNA-binding NtrC family response regulator